MESQDRLQALENVISRCIQFVGSANHTWRETHAFFVARKAIEDYSNGKTPQWIEPKKE